MGAYLSYLETPLKPELQQWTFEEVVHVAARIQKKYGRKPDNSNPHLKRYTGPAGVLFDVQLTRKQFYEDFMSTLFAESSGKTKLPSQALFQALDGRKMNSVFALDALVLLILCCYLDSRRLGAVVIPEGDLSALGVHDDASKAQAQRFMLLLDVIKGNPIVPAVFYRAPNRPLLTKSTEEDTQKSFDETRHRNNNSQQRIHQEQVIQGLISITTAFYLVDATCRLPGADLAAPGKDILSVTYTKSPHCLIPAEAPQSSSAEKAPRIAVLKQLLSMTSGNAGDLEAADSLLKNAKSELKDIITHIVSITNAVSSKGLVPRNSLLSYCLTQMCYHQVITRLTTEKETFEKRLQIGQLGSLQPKIESKSRIPLEEEPAAAEATCVVRTNERAKGSPYKVAKQSNTANAVQDMFRSHLRHKALEKSTSQNIIAEMVYKTNLSLQEVSSLKEDFLPLANSRGELDSQSFKMLMISRFPSFGSDDTSERLFEAFDEDNNGFLDFREFVCGMAKMTSGDLDSKLNIMFDIYDLDGDGKISLQELIRFVKSSSQGIFEAFAQEQEVIGQLTTKTNGQLTLDEFKDLFVDRPVLVQAFGLDSLEEKYNSVIEKVKDVKKTLAKLKDPETLVVVGEAEHVDEKKDIGRRRRGSVVSVIVDEPVSDEAAAAAEFYDNFTFENVMEMYKAWSQQQRFLEDNPKAFEMYINETCCSGMGQSSPNRGYFSQEEERDGDNSTSETLQEFMKYMPTFLTPVVNALNSLPPTDLDPFAFTVILSVVFKADAQLMYILYDLWQACEASKTAFRLTMRETLRILGLALAETPMQKAEVLFRDFDIGGNEYIGLRSLNKMVLTRQAELDRSLSAVTQLLSFMDKDNSGCIEKEEFSEAIHQNPEMLKSFGILLGVSGENEIARETAMKRYAAETIKNQPKETSLWTDDVVKEDLIQRHNFVLKAHDYKFKQFSIKAPNEMEFIKRLPSSPKIKPGGMGPLTTAYAEDKDSKIAQKFSRQLSSDSEHLAKSSDLRVVLNEEQRREIMDNLEDIRTGRTEETNVVSRISGGNENKEEALPRIYKRKDESCDFGGIQLFGRPKNTTEGSTGSSEEIDTNPLVIWDRREVIQNRKRDAQKLFKRLHSCLRKKHNIADEELSKFRELLGKYEKGQQKITKQKLSDVKRMKREHNKLGKMLNSVRYRREKAIRAKIVQPPGPKSFLSRSRSNPQMSVNSDSVLTRSMVTNQSEVFSLVGSEKGNIISGIYCDANPPPVAPRIRPRPTVTAGTNKRLSVASSTSSLSNIDEESNYPWLQKPSVSRGHQAATTPTANRAERKIEEEKPQKKSYSPTDIHCLLNVRPLTGQKHVKKHFSASKSFGACSPFPANLESHKLPIGFGSANYGT